MTRFIPLKGPDYNMDCPDPLCDGWLIFFAEADEGSRPKFVRCSNLRKNDPNSCTLGMILSKRDGTCQACSKPVLKVSCFSSNFGYNIKNKHIYKIGHSNCN